MTKSTAGLNLAPPGETVFQALAAASVDGIILIDRHGIIEFVNASAERIFDYQASELLGRNVSMLIPALHREAHDGYLADYRMTGRSKVIGVIRDIEGQRKDGSLVPVEISLCEVATDGRVSFAGIVRDISVRKRGENEKRELLAKTQQNLHWLESLRKIALAAASTLELQTLAEMVLDELLDALPYAAATLRFFDQETGAALPVACRNIDFETWQAISPSRHSFVDDIINKGACVFSPNLQKDARTTHPEFFRQHGLVAFLGVPLLLKEQPVGILGIFTNDEREFDADEVRFLETLAHHLAASIDNARLHDGVKRQTVSLERTNAQLQREIAERERLERTATENEKLAATGRIAARVAHEINNPLAGILNAFQLVKQAVPKDHTYYSYVGLIEKEIGRIADITRQMYQLYGSETTAAREFSPGDAIRDVVGLLRPIAFQRGIGLAIDCGDRRGLLHSSEAALRQILYNLIGNAIDASPVGAEVKIRAVLGAQGLAVRVSDQGAGIPLEIQPKVFEPFFTSRTGPGGGLGLGLSVSRSLAQSLGGTLSFESAPGRGTTFTLILPPGFDRDEPA